MLYTIQRRETYDHCLDLRCTRKSNLEFASFALYDYCKRQNIGRSHKEMIQVTKNTKKILKDCEKVNTKPIVNNTPKSILENFDMKSLGLKKGNRSQLI